MSESCGGTGTQEDQWLFPRQLRAESCAGKWAKGDGRKTGGQKRCFFGGGAENRYGGVVWKVLKKMGREALKPRRFRYERFGGIVQVGGGVGGAVGRVLRWLGGGFGDRTFALVFVDRERARWLRQDTPPAGLWEEEERGVWGKSGVGEPLSAPLEAHLQLTNRCEAGCATCYTGATREGGRSEWGLGEWCRAVDVLAEAGVFHVALGGGESALLPWLPKLLEHCARRGVVPNLTTSGLYGEDVLERLCGWAQEGLFGQINVSMDGLGPVYRAVRGHDGFGRADRAVVRLKEACGNVGLNTVLARPVFAQLPELFAYAKLRQVREIELLRLKPTGRAARGLTYAALRLSDEEHIALVPKVLGLSKQTGVRARLDCSLFPFVAVHAMGDGAGVPFDAEVLRFFSVVGCAGGDWLVAARSDGRMSACSFAPAGAEPVTDLQAVLAKPGAMAPFRGAGETKPPCATCELLSLCRGGCRAVALHGTGTLDAPDPECPRVLRHGRETSVARSETAVSCAVKVTDAEKKVIR